MSRIDYFLACLEEESKGKKTRPLMFPSSDQVISVPFSQVAIGQEFFWGGFVISRCNWGKKRSSRTADWRANLSGQLQDFVSWSYWKKNESVFIVR